MEIAFTKVALPFGWLGNMSPHTICIPGGMFQGYACELDGNTFRTAEALFQAMRFVDLDAIISIWREKSPMGAKMMAKRNAGKMVISPRSKEDVANMLKVLTLKLEQHPDLKKQLLETEKAKIIEDCSNRRNDSGLFWGAAKVENEWVGHNNLGKLWMQLRTYLDHGIPLEQVRKFGIASFYSA